MDEEQLKEWLRENLEIEFNQAIWSFEHNEIGLRFRGEDRCFTTVWLPIEDKNA